MRDKLVVFHGEKPSTEYIQCADLMLQSVGGIEEPAIPAPLTFRQQLVLEITRGIASKPSTGWNPTEGLLPTIMGLADGLIKSMEVDLVAGMEEAQKASNIFLNFSGKTGQKT